mmetsp:Transcript_105/g.254  ORF Transcript_105/g.254 Transcript_105/m.254 type:complete len:206 (+) Transcript_105:1019-1636(+)
MRPSKSPPRSCCLLGGSTPPPVLALQPAPPKSAIQLSLLITGVSVGNISRGSPTGTVTVEASVLLSRITLSDNKSASSKAGSCVVSGSGGGDCGVGQGSDCTCCACCGDFGSSFSTAACAEVASNVSVTCHFFSTYFILMKLRSCSTSEPSGSGNSSLSQKLLSHFFAAFSLPPASTSCTSAAVHSESEMLFILWPNARWRPLHC